VIARTVTGEHDSGRDRQPFEANGLERANPPHRALLLIVSALLLGAALAGDVWTGSEVASSLFYVVAILFGAWFLGLEAGVLLALASVVGWWVAYRIAGRPFSHLSVLYWNLLAELAIYCITAVAVAETRLSLDRLHETARLLEAARDALDRETHAVGELQREMLPAATPAVPGYAWDTTYLTSTRAGGDYYDFLPAADGRVAIIVADASGHGAPAAVLMAMLRALVHAEPAGREAPEAWLANLNRQLAGTLAAGRFVTACIAWLEPATGRIEYSLAGHPPPWIVRGSAHRAECLASIGGPPLGLFVDASYERGQAVLAPGDTLVFHTDGLTEAMGPTRELFGEARLAESLALADGQALATMRSALLERVDRHRAGAPLSDDLSLLLVRRTACVHGPEAPALD
jgi:serine phosphatase RsbU (regulator of sigma subunit)